MRLTDNLITIADAAHKDSALVVQAAGLDNVVWDESVAPNRTAQYLRYLAEVETAPDWKSEHDAEYYPSEVRVARQSPVAPHTFRPDNSLAQLGELDNAFLIRVESLVRFQRSAISRPSSGEPLFEAFWTRFFNSQKDMNPADPLRRDPLVDEFLKCWNEEQRIFDSPMFCSFLAEFGELSKLVKSDWPHELRDRLGLAHLQPNREAIPVALMCYSVNDVHEWLVANANAPWASAFARPTALDGELSPVFHPVPFPAATNFGYTLHLDAAADRQQFTPEILNARIDYQPHHLKALGWISRPHALGNPPIADSLRHARNAHLIALQARCSRADFGALLPE